MLTPDDEDATYRLDVKLQHLLHVGGYLGQQHVGPVVTTHVSDDDGPHGAGREDRFPWCGTLQIMYTFQWNCKSRTPFSGTANHVHISVELEITYTFQWNWKSCKHFSGTGNHIHISVELEIM